MTEGDFVKRFCVNWEDVRVSPYITDEHIDGEYERGIGYIDAVKMELELKNIN